MKIFYTLFIILILSSTIFGYDDESFSASGDTEAIFGDFDTYQFGTTYQYFVQSTPTASNQDKFISIISQAPEIPINTSDEIVEPTGFFISIYLVKLICWIITFIIIIFIFTGKKNNKNNKRIWKP